MLSKTSWETLRDGSSKMGRLIMLAGHHSSAAYAKLCKRYTDHPEVMKPSWARALWNEVRKEFCPVREVMLYRFSKLPVPDEEPGPSEMKTGSKKRKSGVLHGGPSLRDQKLHFARVIASTDNMIAAKLARYDANTAYL